MVGWFTKADAFLLGRKTYDIFASHWPKVTDEADPIAGRLNTLPKYVVSRSQRPLGWQHSHPVTGDVPAEIGTLKERPGNELQVHGSGKRIFPEGDMGAALRLVDSKATGAGVQILTYEPAGPAQYGSFA
jgi:dihydrofolate reductase